MSQIYSDPTRAHDPHSLPDTEVFYLDSDVYDECSAFWGCTVGWYWWACFPGCMPDGDPVGPFATESEAIDNAQSHA